MYSTIFYYKCTWIDLPWVDWGDRGPPVVPVAAPAVPASSSSSATSASPVSSGHYGFSSVPPPPSPPLQKKGTFYSFPAHSFPIKLERPKMKKSITRPRPPFFPRNRSRPPRLQKEMTCPIIFLGPRESRARDKDLFSRSSESNPRFIRALCIPGKRRLWFKMHHRRLRLTAAKLQTQAFIEKSLKSLLHFSSFSISHVWETDSLFLFARHSLTVVST